jgi:arylsulfatase A-like enzyme
MLVAVVAAFGCDGGPEQPPNVILITMDTMRGDHLGCYGYRRPTSPRIDEFAKVSTFYTRPIASAPWTVPTHASLFTGKDPFEHGAHTLKATTKFIQDVRVLHDVHLTLAEALAQEGYTTGAFVSNDGYLDTHWRLNQGFQTYHVEGVVAEVLNLRVYDWLDSVAATGAPFFLFINYMDTHNVYNTKPRPGLLPEPAIRDDGELLETLYRAVMPGVGEIPRDLQRKVIDQYDTAVANLDEQIGLLIDRLHAMGLYDNTMIVLTSDHGEYFGEHHLVAHSKDVYQSVAFIPLMIKDPGQSTGLRDDTVISSSDIPRRVLSRLPRDIAQKYMAAFPNTPGNHPVICELYYTRGKDLFHPVWGHRFDRVRTAVFDWPYKYIQSSDGKSELYDLQNDWQETTNLLDREPDVAKEMQASLQVYFDSRPRFTTESDQPPLTEEQVRKLKALGYVGD